MITGVLGAMEAEVSLLRDALSDRVDEHVLGVDVHRGNLDGHRVVLARSGVGKVNAALATAALVQAGADAVIFTGLAGGLAPDVRIGDVVVADDLVQHDVDVTALGRQPGELLGEPLAWTCDATLRERAVRAVVAAGGEGSVHVGRIASGDAFIASQERQHCIRDTFGALCAEMEGAATAQVCTRLDVPFVVVRSISDEADATADVDFPAFLAAAARRGLAHVRAFVAVDVDA